MSDSGSSTLITILVQQLDIFNMVTGLNIISVIGNVITDILHRYSTCVNQNCYERQLWLLCKCTNESILTVRVVSMPSACLGVGHDRITCYLRPTYQSYFIGSDTAPTIQSTASQWNSPDTNNSNV